jgi:hypothetical protein
MGIIALLINRSIADRLGGPGLKRASFADPQNLCLAHGSGQTAHPVACISADWLQSIRSLVEPGKVNWSSVIVVPIPA